MRLKQVVPLAAALLCSAAPAHAAPAPAQVVVVEVCVDEKAAASIENRVTAPLEKLLLKLPNVADLQSMTFEGVVRFELLYTDGAGRSELAAAQEAIGRAAIAPGVRILSRSAQLASESQDKPYLAERSCGATRP